MNSLYDDKKQAGMVSHYISIIRLDHLTKHIFIFPGFVLAYLLRQPGISTKAVTPLELIPNIIYGLVVAICIASANYAINEFLDRDFDRFHPTKSQRASVQYELDGRIVAFMWLVLVVIGLAAASRGGMLMVATAIVFALQGIFYNVPPLRTKDKPYFDVISESINNPLRLILGWLMVDGTTLPPASVILAYWLGGAFLMNAKRLSEYREIVAAHGKDILVRYRASFAGYTESSLTVACLIYSLLSSFFLAVFLIKYRIEYLLLMPVISCLFGLYMSLSMKAGSTAQAPERLFKERGLMILVAIIGIMFVLLTIYDIPGLAPLTEQHFISFR